MRIFKKAQDIIRRIFAFLATCRMFRERSMRREIEKKFYFKAAEMRGDSTIRSAVSHEMRG